MMEKTAASLGVMISGIIALAMPVCAFARERADSFDFATARSGNWDLRATTSVKLPEPAAAGRQPTVAAIECRGESPDFIFNMNDVGALSFFRPVFLGAADKDGERGEVTLLGDHLWLYVDGERWEFANIHAHSSEFSNLRYPAPEGDVVLTWRGHAAVRKTERDPWLHLSRLYERLINARKIEWSFKSRNWKDVDSRTQHNRLPAGWNVTRYPVDNRGLREAILWCTRQVSSDAAYILPPPGQLITPEENGRPG